VFLRVIKNIGNLVKWFCKQLTIDELFIAAGAILAFLNNKLKEIKCKSTNLLNNISCSNCGAPGKFIYYNDGRKRTQIRCKVCSALSQVKKNYKPNNAKYWFPHSGYALFLWKTFASFTAFKCLNYFCTEYINNFKKLSKEEKELCEEK